MQVRNSDKTIDLCTYIGRVIYENYNEYHGFVIYHPESLLVEHSTSLSFRFENQIKPVIFVNYWKSDIIESL